jgi:non-specific serine/threonine protein kinase/serine/threonine-protein kinase
MMASTDSLRRVAAIFDELADLPAEQQMRALADLRERDPALEAAVRRLIEADAESAARLPAAAAEASKAEANQGRIFGPYRALSLIGQGGMGAVYLAERADGQYTRRTAIKVVQGSIVSPEMRIRFLAERQILATLQHPGVASLIDGGVTEDGEPYLVMEFVDGMPLDRFADQNRLTVPQRIDLFLEVCEAVDFAHRHLIIHRDLKPSNVLVDHEGKPKLLDFGAAKLLAPTEADQTRQFLTPRYASPEQMRGAPASVSMDVYSLGVILYELVTGCWPFGDPADLPGNLKRATGEVAPSDPTSHVTQDAADARSTNPGTLKKTLAGDLTAILAKALESDVSRRYGSISDLAADLLRFRRHEPVLAQTQSAAYRLRKWIKRNPVQTAAAGLAIFGVLTGVALREQQRWVAELRFDELRSLARFQIFELQDQMAYYGAAMPLRKAMAERSLAALDQLSQESSPNFELQADLTEGYIQLAELLGNPLRANLGELAQGRKTLARARQMNDILQTMQGATKVKQVAQAHLDLQEAMYDTGLLRAKDKAEKAAQSMRTLEAAMDLQNASAAELARMATLCLVLHVNMSQTSGGVDLFPHGGSHLEKGRSLIDQAVRKDGRNPVYRLTAFQIGVQEASALAALDNAKGREKMIELLGSLDGMEPSERIRFVRARLLGTLGWLEGQMKLFDEGIDHIRQSAGGWRQLMESNPQQVNYRYEWTGALRDLSFVHEYSGKSAETLTAMEEAIREQQRLLEISQNNVTRRQLAELRVRVATHLVKAGRIEEARASIHRGQDALLEIARRPDAGIGPLTLAGRYLVSVPLADCKRPGEALELARRAVHVDPTDPVALESLAVAYAENGMRAEAMDALKRKRALVPPGNESAIRNEREIEKQVETTLAALGK